MTFFTGEKIKVFNETDTEAYIRAIREDGFKVKQKGEYLIVGERDKRQYGKKDWGKLDCIGNRIHNIRKQMYFTTEELAEEIGTKAITIEAWEDGRTIPKGKTFERFLEFSGATREYIMDGVGEWKDEIKEIMRELHKENG